MKRKLPKGLELWRSPRGVVNFHGVPMFRMHAWALLDYEHHNPGRLFVNSAIRDDRILRAFNRKYRTNLKSQQYLYDHQNEPGFFPANPPSRTSHAGFSDGNPHYGPVGSRLPKYKWGIDAVARPGGDAAGIVGWLNNHGYHATRPYPTTSERHHLSFTRYPARNARKRLRAWRKTK
jgi:hypothetical protein